LTDGRPNKREDPRGENMGIGIVLLIVIAVPAFFQIVMLARDQRRRHAEILERLERLEGKLGA
jgi:hypothetical protein